MKNVVLIIGGETQSNASGFVKEYEILNGRIHSILCLQSPKSNASFLKYPVKLLRKFDPRKLNGGLNKILCKLNNLQSLQQLKNSWNISGENSWDLLDAGINIIDYASEKKIPYYFISSLTPDVLKKFTDKGPAIFVMYGGGILDNSILDIKNAEFFNAHMGEMPRYRGMNVIEWSVLENETPKVSVMTMASAIDGGDVIYEKEIPIKGIRTISELRKVGYIYCYKAMAEGIFKYSKGEVNLKKQGPGAKYYYRMHKEIRNLLNQKLN